MFHLVKPGHILRFTTCPSTIISPPGVKGTNDNTLATAWPMVSTLGLVQCLSHPSGNIGSMATDVVKRLRTTPNSLSRVASYSAPGQLLTKSDRVIASEVCDFVGYVDGQSNYIQSARTVFSKDFTGCLMVVYTVAGQRHVAHVAASSVPNMDCKQAFLNTIQNMNAVLNGWFRPIMIEDEARTGDTFAVVGKYVGNDPNRLTTFGVVTQAGQAYAVDAFKPKGLPGNDWIVTDVRPKMMSQNWHVT